MTTRRRIASHVTIANTTVHPPNTTPDADRIAVKGAITVAGVFTGRSMRMRKRATIATGTIVARCMSRRGGKK
jgi:hypothetical protein